MSFCTFLTSAVCTIEKIGYKKRGKLGSTLPRHTHLCEFRTIECECWWGFRDYSNNLILKVESLRKLKSGFFFFLCSHMADWCEADLYALLYKVDSIQLWFSTLPSWVRLKYDWSVQATLGTRCIPTCLWVCSGCLFMKPYFGRLHFCMAQQNQRIDAQWFYSVFLQF